MGRNDDTRRSEDGEPNPIINAVSNAVAAIRADDEQLELAKAHEGLGPKAIEKLTVAEARLQPTAADAVKALLTQQGSDRKPTRSVTDAHKTRGPCPALIRRVHRRIADAV